LVPVRQALLRLRSLERAALTTGHSRLVNGLFVPQPDFIYSGHGTNDGLTNKTVSTLQLSAETADSWWQSLQDSVVIASASAWLSAVRQAAPDAWIFLCIPFGQFKGELFEQALPSLSADLLLLVFTLRSASAERRDGQIPIAGQRSEGRAA
jgi:hypothetical protein